MLNLQVTDKERRGWLSLGLFADSSEIMSFIRTKGHKQYKSHWRFISPGQEKWVVFIA